MVLIDSMRSEFGKSKRLLALSLFTSGALLLMSVAVFFIDKGFLSLMLEMTFLLLPILLFVFREMSSDHQACGEEIRRLLMLYDGLEYQPDPLTLANLESRLGKINKSEPLFTAPYYDSKLPKGANRLADILTESSFFTMHLSKTLVKVFLICACITGFIAVLIISTVLCHGISQTDGELAAKSFAALMASIVAGDAALLLRRYSCLAVATERVLSVSDNLRKEKNASIVDVMKIVDEYNCAVLQCPPIPGWIYASRRETLNNAWRKKEEVG